MHDYLSLGGRVADRLQHLVLPVVTLALLSTAAIARYQRAALLATCCRATGCARRSRRGSAGATPCAATRSATRCSPPSPSLGLSLPAFAAGAVFVEKVFSWPGMGLVTVNAIARARLSARHGRRAGDERRRRRSARCSPTSRSPLADPRIRLRLRWRRAGGLRAVASRRGSRAMAACASPPSCSCSWSAARSSRRCIAPYDPERAARHRAAQRASRRRSRIRSAPIRSAATCCRACSTARASRSPSRSWPSRSSMSLGIARRRRRGLRGRRGGCRAHAARGRRALRPHAAARSSSSSHSGRTSASSVLTLLIAGTGWFAVSRLVRAETLAVRERGVRGGGAGAGRAAVADPGAARAAERGGAGARGRHARRSANVILLEAGLSYLGIGVRPPAASWGSIIQDGAERVSATSGG